MSADELAEAEQMARHAVDRRYPLNHEYLVPVMAEYDRLRAVEKAAAALVEHYDDPSVCVVGVRAAELLDALTDALNGGKP